MKPYLTPKDVADHFQVSTGSVERWIATGRLPAVKLGKFWRVRRDWVPDAPPAPRPRPRRTTLPTSGVYMLFANEVLTYVGRSSELPRRITNHRRAGRVFDEVRAIPCDASTAKWLEAELVRTLNPVENIKRFARRAKRIEAALEALAL